MVPDGNKSISTHLKVPCSFFCALSKLIIESCMSFKVFGGKILAYSILRAIFKISFAKEEELRDGKKAELWPLYVLLSENPNGIATQEALLTWWKARGNTNEDSATRIRIFFSLINSMGVTIPSELWAIISDDPKPVKNYGPRASVRNALSQAAAAGSPGGTVVLSLIALGDRGTDPENLSAAELSIVALKRLGFDEEARAIALEVAIEAGL